MGRQGDKACDAAVARLAAEQWGVLSLAELRACGLSDKAVLLRVRAGRLHRLHRSVYAVGHTGVPLEGRFLAAVKASGGVLSHRSAAAVFGILEWEERHVEVTLARTGTRRIAGLRVHRAPLGLDDVKRHDGIAVTSLARTLVDLSSVLPYAALRRTVRESQTRRLTSVPHILAALERAGPWRGRQTLMKIAADGPAPTRSELEDVVLELILRGGLARPDVNVAMTLSGRRIVPDLRWPAQRLVVEADGAAWHDHRLAREDDAERQALLERHGERVLRVTRDQAVGRPNETLARLRAAGAPPARHELCRPTSPRGKQGDNAGGQRPSASPTNAS
jgi:hypothetical protein